MRRACLPLLLLAAPVAASGQPNDAAVARFNECAAVQDDAQRLACFDRVTREVRAAARPQGVTAPSSPAPAPTQQVRVQQEREDFGLDVRQREARRPEPVRKIDRVTARVAAARPFGAGLWAFMLEDGAIWELKETNPAFSPPKRGDTVRIRRGMMGGYLLYVGGQPSMRVARIS